MECYRDTFFWLVFMVKLKWDKADYTFTDSPQAICTAVASPAIIHYTGYPKPWENTCTHPRANLYWRYLKQTPWHNAQPVHGKRSVLLRESLTQLLISLQYFFPLPVKNWLIAKAYRRPGVR